MKSIGIVHGRFQVLHLDHLEYILRAKDKCDYLLIGITNPDPSSTRVSSSNPHRSDQVNNPLSFFERLQMIRAVLTEAGVSREDYDIIPFPINVPELIQYYIPKDSVHYLTIYDTWGEHKLSLLQRLGYEVEVLWHKQEEDKAMSSSQIRALIRNHEPWHHLVPKATYDYVNQPHTLKTIRENHEE